MEIKVTEGENDAVNIDISGTFGFQDHIAFNDIMAQIQDKKKSVTFDLEHLEMIDSAGIGMLFLAQKLIKKSHGEMTLKNPVAQVKRVFDITSIGQQIPIIEE